MNLNTVFPIPTWLSTDEKKRYNKMKRPFLAHARDLGIKMDPFLLAQINDYLITDIMLSRAEISLQNPDAMPSENLFKQREKLGKMLQELRAAFDKAAEKMQAFSSQSHPENPVNPVENPPLFSAPDQTDQSDPSDIPQSSPSSLCLGASVVNPPSLPISPPITPNTVAAYTARRNTEREHLQSLLLPPQTKAVAA